MAKGLVLCIWRETKEINNKWNTATTIAHGGPTYGQSLSWVHKAQGRQPDKVLIGAVALSKPMYKAASSEHQMLGVCGHIEFCILKTKNVLIVLEDGNSK